MLNASESERLAVTLLPCIGGEQLERLLADTALGVDLELERRRKTFAFRIARLAVDDERDHGALRMTLLEEPDLLAAAGEQSTISADEASSAARVCSVRVRPAVKSSRSRKMGLIVFGIGPLFVSLPARSPSMRKLSSPRCSHLA